MNSWCRALVVLASTACGSPPAAVPAPAARATAHSAAPKAPAATVATPSKASCDDAKIDAGESCDDGNSRGGDGCSGGCRREPLRFLSWDYALLGDGVVVSRKSGDAV